MVLASRDSQDVCIGGNIQGKSVYKVPEKVILGDVYHDFVSGKAMNCLCMQLANDIH